MVLLVAVGRKCNNSMTKHDNNNINSIIVVIVLG